MSSFIIKLALMPTIVAFVTLAGRRWGNNVAGILASLPLVAGPILLFITLEQGIPFAVSSISGVMVGILGWILFCVVYILVGQRFNAFFSTLAGYAAYICLGILAQRLIPVFSLLAWFCITLIVIFVALKFFPKIKNIELSEPRKLHYEIPLRMLVITIFVVSITYFAELLGSTWSGILTPFPIITAVLAIFTHYTQGIAQVRKIFVGLFTGIFGFTTFLYLQAYLLPITSIFNAFLCGIVADILLTLMMKKILRKVEI